MSELLAQDKCYNIETKLKYIRTFIFLVITYFPPGSCIIPLYAMYLSPRIWILDYSIIGIIIVTLYIFANRILYWMLLLIEAFTNH